MKAAGQITLLSLPRTDFRTGKRRPALLLARVPGAHDDWIVAMISSQLGQQVADFDEVIRPGDADFASSGLKQESLIRVGRVAVVASEMMPGTIGEIGQDPVGGSQRRSFLYRLHRANHCHDCRRDRTW